MKWIVPPGWWQLLSILVTNSKKKDTLALENRLLLAQNKWLRDRHKGERCFILGAGSSIAMQDLTKLIGENVISVSNTFVHQDYNEFKPKYHVLPALIASHAYLNNGNEKLISWLKEMDKKILEAEFFFHIGDRDLIESNKLFKDKKKHWNEYVNWDEQSITDIDLARVPSIWSVSEYAITIALYMGFDKIYLIGFDHDWFNGPLVYFYDEKKKHMMQPNKERISFADSEFQMRRHAK
ncbi:MAG: hypothetical protein HAW67_00660, partial [Endozoicomonadaceae bacterium]|nr:hypothetical protein [Endozoicomonadaceae bacterium]